MMKILFALKLVICFLCLIVSGLWGHESRVYSEPREKTVLPNLIIASQNGVVNLVYHPSSQKYEKLAELARSGITGIVRHNNYIFVSTKNEVLKLDSELKQTASINFETEKRQDDIQAGALATDNKNIFVSAQKSFIALDENLKELSRVKLECKGREKNAHGILIYKNTAYLLDNLRFPLFLFQVNIENTKNMRIIEKIEIDGINQHLDTQWLNPELNQWLVIKSYGHRGGGGEIAHIYPLNNKGGEKLVAQEIFRRRRFPEKKVEGFKIRGITNFPPVWAVVLTNGKYWLSQIKSEGNKVSSSETIDLYDMATNKQFIVKRKNDFLFVASDAYLYNTGKAVSPLKVVDLRGKTKIIHYEDLREFNVRAIIDILPY